MMFMKFIAKWCLWNWYKGSEGSIRACRISVQFKTRFLKFWSHCI